MYYDTPDRRRYRKGRLRAGVIRSPRARPTAGAPVSRSHCLTFLGPAPAAMVVMEACGSAHYWARRIVQLGHRVVLLPPHHVRPYVKRNKTDPADAKGMLEAVATERSARCR